MRVFVALPCDALGPLLGAVTLIVAFWEESRVLASMLATAGFVGTVAVAVWSVFRGLTEWPRLLEATLGELRPDRNALIGVPSSETQRD